jgi:N-carbamoylputrescine amidase
VADFQLIQQSGPLPSPMHAGGPVGRVLRVGAVQCAWSSDALTHADTIRQGVAMAAGAGAEVVFLQELTLSPYFCSSPDVPDALARYGEDLETGPTLTLLRSMAADHDIPIQGSLYERTADGRGFNTAVCVDAGGRILTRTRKTHIPEFPHYHENLYFEPADTDCGVVEVAGAVFSFPTCWDQWFPELARAVSMQGAQVIAYPTAIGSEPDMPGFDSQPMWRQMIAANGLANATFMIAVNRIGDEPPLTFYGSSFISDPFGRIVVEAPRDRPAVLVADLDLGLRNEMLSWGLFSTRRPDRYRTLLTHTDPGRT